MLSAPTDIHDISFAIRDAVAPVFLLTGIGSLMSVLVNRLGRAVDRARHLHTLGGGQRSSHAGELAILLSRTTWMRRSVALFIFAGLCVSLSIAAVFVGVAIGVKLSMFVLLTFILAMVSLILGLLCFLREILLATGEVIAPPGN
ncbi:MAG: DUF2721 domain-containing protein [Methylobacterium sp.]|nr:DUF2721 domain-containing protein [Methylobacterium sp.]